MTRSMVTPLLLPPPSCHVGEPCPRGVAGVEDRCANLGGVARVRPTEMTDPPFGELKMGWKT